MLFNREVNLSFTHILLGFFAFAICIAGLGMILVLEQKPASAAQSVPYRVNFQGRLTNASGNIVANGLYNMQFRLYDATTGGTLLWTETRETTNRVQVTNGLFSVQLGSVTALSPTLFSDAAARHLEITMATPATATCSTASCASWESPMTPRQALASSTYALNSDLLDGQDGSFYQDASNLNAGTISASRLSGSYTGVTGTGAIAAGSITSGFGTIVTGNTIQGTRLISTVTTGTAPLTVASTTVVTNLNSDLLDGQSGSYYQSATNLNAGTINTARVSGSYTGITAVGALSSLVVQNTSSQNVLTADGAAGTVALGLASSSDTFTKLTNPPSQAVSDGMGVAYSNNGDYLVYGNDSSPLPKIYKRSGDTYTKLTDPTATLTGYTTGVSFSPDDQYLTVTISDSPFITIYKRSGDTFTKLADPATLPTDTASKSSWSPDGLYMTVAHNTSPFITIYKRSGDTFTKLANPATLPPGLNVYNSKFSSNGQYLAVTHGTSPFITIYKRSGDTFTKLANPATLPLGLAIDVSFSPDDLYMTVALGDSPYILTYKRSGDTFTKIADPVSLPAGLRRGVDYSPDGQYVALTGATSPNLVVYRVGTGNNTNLTVNGSLTSTGTILGAQLNVSGNASMTGNLFVAGETVFANTARIHTDSVSAFAIQNSVNGTVLNVDSVGAGEIEVFGGSSGFMGSWSAGTVPGGTNPAVSTSVTMGGYIYVFNSGDNKTRYAKLNGDGSVGTWQQDVNNIPQTLQNAGAVAVNGYVYILGGHNGTTYSASVYYARQNTNGSLGAWSTATNSLPATRSFTAAFAANGYLYSVGGYNGTTQTAVYSAKLNADGSVGTWQTGANPLPVAIVPATYTYVNGRFYIATGDQMYYATVDRIGGTSTWTNVTLPFVKDAWSLVSVNNYMYALGGDGDANIHFAKINLDGSFGTWTVDTAASASIDPLHGGDFFGYKAVVHNGWVYIPGTNAMANVAYAKAGGRVQIAGSLDLVGLQGGSLTDTGTSSMGGSIVAGDIMSVGSLTIQGTTTLNSSLTVNDTFAINTKVDNTGYAAVINNESTTTSADGLLIKLGVASASRTTFNYFAAFADGTGAVAGKIQGGASAVAYTTTGADYAEYFRADPANLPQPGELVTLDSARANGVRRASGTDMAMGVISTNPGFVGNGPICYADDEACDANYAKSNALVSLVGQVPLKVAGDIKVGDMLGASDVPGVAQKITSGSYVGYALTASENGIAQVLIRPGFTNSTSAIQGGDGIFTSLMVNGPVAVESLTVTGDARVEGKLTVIGTVETGNIIVNGHITTKGDAPSIKHGVAMGALGNGTVAIDGTDAAGSVNFKVNVDQAQAGIVAHVDFASEYNGAYKTVLSATNDAATDLRVYIVKTATGFDIVSKDPLTSGIEYSFDYIVIGTVKKD